jgi:23S rRNA (guanosine2251-2'-O)-methyltransferase
MTTVTLKNPHSVLAAMETRPQDVLEVRLARRSPQDAWGRVVEKAREVGVAVRIAPPERGPSRKRNEDKEGRAGSADAVVRERQPVDLRDLFAVNQQAPGIWLALDQIQDPHNIGAIFRTAAFFGIRGIVMTKHKSAPLTAVACDVSSGGVEHVPFALETNLRQSMEAAKKAGLWVLGTSEHAERPLWDVDRDRNWLVVLGNEESGLRRLTQETCDELCAIPAHGAIGSLNVSVAAGLVMGALTR